MYTAVTVGFLGVAVLRGAFGSWVLVGVLAVFFELKTRREERYLRAAYADYAGYAAQTGKFVPRWRTSSA
jgi:protein-S-isoprenylcysteine O-methyltransferase Ste14